MNLGIINEYAAIIGMIGIFLVTVVLIMIRENHERKVKLEIKLNRMWGGFSEREYTQNQFESISHYMIGRREKEEKEEEKRKFFLDDITWNDLDMDRIFMLLNQTVSSPGQDYLYYQLHTPQFQEEPLKEQERLYCYMKEHPEERKKVQAALAAIGIVPQAPDSSISDAVHILGDVAMKSNVKHILMAVLAACSVLSFFMIPKYGIFILIAVMAYNIIMYLMEKGELEMYLNCFQCVMRLLEVSNRIVKLPIAGIEEYRERLKNCNKDLAKFKQGSSLVINRGNLVGGIETMILDYFRMFTHLDLIKFNSMLTQIRENRAAIDGLLETLGMLDSAIAIASCREALPYYSQPSFLETTQAQISLQVENLYHPLIAEPVANSIAVSTGTLVTGSNASGKSTFLKNVAINTILAQSIHTCVATNYQAPFLRVMTSMALRDDLQSGESYYIVEIKSLNRILEAANETTPLLCVIDEVLRGTNTIERIAASSQILAALSRPSILAFAATHDIELSYMLEKFYQNYHFAEEVQAHDVVFNYLLKNGRATTRNAIRLLRMLGYDENIVTQAEQAAENFEKEGVWAPVKERETYVS